MLPDDNPLHQGAFAMAAPAFSPRANEYWYSDGNLGCYVVRTTAAGGGSPDLRASLAASQMVGLAVSRYVLRIEPLASTPAAELAAHLGPTLDRYLTGTLGSVPEPEQDEGAAPSRRRRHARSAG